MEERELLDRASGGDQEALAALYDLYRNPVLRYLASMIPDSSRAEDLVQETFRRAMGALDRVRAEAGLAPFLYKVAVNLARNHFRDKARQAIPQAPQDLLGEKMGGPQRRGVLSSVMRRELAELLDQAIDSLPLDLREAFLLHYVEEISYADMEGITEIASGTLRVRAHRAKALLRRRLGSVVDTAWGEPPAKRAQ